MTLIDVKSFFNYFFILFVITLVLLGLLNYNIEVFK